MEGDPDLPAQPPEAKFFKPNSNPINITPDCVNLSRSFNTTSTCTSTTSSSSSSPPELVRHIQATFKRHRPLGMMQPNSIRPRRFLVAQRGTPKESDIKDHLAPDVKNNKEAVPEVHKLKSSIQQTKAILPDGGDIQEDASLTPPSEWGTVVDAHEENSKPCITQTDQAVLYSRSGINDAVSSSRAKPENLLLEVQRKVHFSMGNISQGIDDQMVSGTDDLLSHINSLALTEMELNVGNQADTSAAGNGDWQHHDIQSMEMDDSLRSEGVVSSVLARRIRGVQDQQNQFRSFLQNDPSNAMSQPSLLGGSSVTSTVMNLSSAPMVSSTTHSLQTQIGGTHLGTGIVGKVEGQLNAVHPSHPSSENADGMSFNQSVVTSEVINPTPTEIKRSVQYEKRSSLPHDHKIAQCSSYEDNNSVKVNVDDVKSHARLPPSNVKLEHPKSEKLETGASSKAASTSRKKGYDPDLFFKVNGKLYQRLGKIGSGGSSEVHKVISSDCMIYALKKIKLKGRDYATAYGFCQEIEYLNRLKGKNNIIQLIDYEVTDKTLVEIGSNSNMDGRVRGDAYIYMVLEYGEIDLAHMLAQKWKELDGSKSMIDENWLRFYWQQILLAVNTIHEERIVHSDLKPANFLLVRGSLKLIDFGIAKAIMSDTTNIQRDSQVGTLSYMSPEAFMCNETDASGNTIKCGRSSDIWSLGCILYQMVYGRTPFSEYKTFLTKFKAITDPNREIIYEPVSNPWLLDLMKKCLAWDRNKRCRIPELLQHPFLVPPVPPKSPSPPDKHFPLSQLITKTCASDDKTLELCSQLQSLLMDPKQVPQLDSTMARDQLRKLLCKVSTTCFQLQEHLASL